MPLSGHFKTLSHHAYCIPGDPSVCIGLKAVLAHTHSIPQQANPDFFEQTFQTFTIDDARNLKSLHETRPIGPTGKKIFIVIMTGITGEAQNALLKLLEEPAEYAHFFLIIPSAHLLLPTVKSRLLIIGDGLKPASSEEVAADAHKFIKASAAKKLDSIKKLMDDISKEKKTRQDAIAFLDAIEAQVYRDKNIKANHRTLESISLVRKYIHDRSPSVKMLLEYMALAG
jgi:DNA polymerase III delta prime subunit